ncbi:flagellar hook-length control protein FliK [Metabacillus halosaccharovorans]|uniref:flagellar hook-length control protein FliK n=1 Tax=Metabacillus halosaccharovorans TaxID=930124 RepID=UPI000994DDB2|nr:flagellar hook-length control protein FliK [Metabacillus halosaccharovorans]
MKVFTAFDIQSTPLKKTNQVQNSSSFKNYVDSALKGGTSTAEKTNQEDKNNVLTKVKHVIKEILDEQDENLDILEITGEDLNEYLSILQTKLNELFNQSGLMNNLFDSTDQYPLGITVLALVTKIETLSKKNDEIDTNQLMTDLNELLKIDFESYEPPQVLTFQNIFLKLDNMKLEDKALLEGQILISNAKVQVLDELRYLSEILSVTGKLSDKALAIDLLNKNLLDNSNATENMQKLLSSNDLGEIKNLLSKLVNIGESTKITNQLNNTNLSLLQTKNVPLKSSNLIEETVTIHLEKFIKTDHFMTVGENKPTITSTREELTNKMVDLLKNSKFSLLNNGTSRFVIKLTPEHLGSITIKIVQQRNGEMVAKIIAATQSAKELLEHSGSQLKQALPNMNIEFEKFDIFTDDIPKFFRDNNDTKQETEKENKNSSSNNEEENDMNFKDSLQEALNFSI